MVYKFENKPCHCGLSLHGKQEKRKLIDHRTPINKISHSGHIVQICEKVKWETKFVDNQIPKIKIRHSR